MTTAPAHKYCEKCELRQTLDQSSRAVFLHDIAVKKEAMRELIDAATAFYKTIEMRNEVIGFVLDHFRKYDEMERE